MKGSTGRKPFVAIDHIKDFNEFKATFQEKAFTKNNFRDELKTIGMPCNDVFWASFIRLKVVKRISRTYFVFSDNKPTHFKLLETIYLDYSNRLARYIRNSKVNRAKQEQETKRAYAVKFLKSFGFQIYAPVEDLYSKL